MIINKHIGKDTHITRDLGIPLSQCSKDLVLFTLSACFIDVSEEKTTLIAKSNRKDGQGKSAK